MSVRLCGIGDTQSRPIPLNSRREFSRLWPFEARHIGGIDHSRRKMLYDEPWEEGAPHGGNLCPLSRPSLPAEPTAGRDIHTICLWCAAQKGSKSGAQERSLTLRQEPPSSGDRRS